MVDESVVVFILGASNSEHPVPVIGGYTTAIFGVVSALWLAVVAPLDVGRVLKEHIRFFKHGRQLKKRKRRRYRKINN